MNERTRIINVVRKPRKCPFCGAEIWDIIYKTGDLTEVFFFLWYRKSGIMGGDNIPRRPPIWACSCGCKRFRKVNPDGTDAPVKIKMLKNIRKRPASIINWTTSMASRNTELKLGMITHNFIVDIETEFGEKESLSITGCNSEDAEAEARELVASAKIGLKGRLCTSVEVNYNSKKGNRK